MRPFTAVFALWCLYLRPVHSEQYQLLQTYNASNFFEEFRFFSSADPTGGFVEYVPFETALTTGIVTNETGLVYLGVDSTNVYTPNDQGRPSVRLESKMTFTEGLFVIDLTHMPVGCGTWPAFWTAGLGDWGKDGEIDIIENVNDARSNNAALHTAGDCAVLNSSSQTGLWKSTDCNTGHDGNQGCGTTFTEPYNYGAEFNANGGGLYAMEWRNDTIDIWFFSRDNVPDTLRDSTAIPNTKSFGTPSASFAGPCSSSFGEKFFNHTIILDTTFCGGWAGRTFGGGTSECPVSKGSTPLASCVDYVARNPKAFTDAWWGIKSLRVWEKKLHHLFQ
ncbi:glycoside hydrolase family 16 protein [Periconia macrospinosa]|uniref:Glycoside hydrolase family 16 protein n=1 Tax=Periconia macrospinosa TaxID=97972 RepID=A0A2V1ECC7_9PLEO|nr:glycoside hydrolase family 16 protein [Periconia macrospinosa]